MPSKRNSLGVIEQKAGRAFDDLSKLDIPVEEIRRMLRRRAGKKESVRPKSGEGKSTTIRMRDIALLARLDNEDLIKFSRDIAKYNGKKFGTVRIKRLTNILLQVDAGLITKSQYGVYHFHETPQVAPIKEMKFNMSTGKIMQGIKEAKFATMPSFKKILGGL
jgi:hypothetical protein